MNFSSGSKSNSNYSIDLLICLILIDVMLIQKSIIGIALLFLSCSGGDITPPQFDGEAAFIHLGNQVAFGPRVPGTQASKDTREYIYTHLERCGLNIDSQAVSFLDPYTQTDTPLVNVIGSYVVTEGEPAILIAAHYDSRPRTDYPTDLALADNPIAGANDGASGVALLLELASVFLKKPPPVNVDLVFVDAEDWGKSGDPDHYLIGSREYGRSGIRDKYFFGIVVDLIGDADQQIFREVFTQKYYPALNDMIWQTAAKLDITTFVDTIRHTVLDDHLSFSTSGVPTALIIDFDYPYWHTDLDLVDKCSSASLENVGRVITEIIYRPSLWPKMK